MKKTLLLLSLVALNASSALALSPLPAPHPEAQAREERGQINGRRDGATVERANRCQQHVKSELRRAQRGIPGAVEINAALGDPYLTGYAKGYTAGQAEEAQVQTACNN